MRKHRKLGTLLIAVASVAATSTSGGRVSTASLFSQQSATDFSKFHHDNPNHARLPCLLCHRRETNSVQPTLPGKDKYTPCIGCHAAQFAGNAGPICTICHTDAQSRTVKSFPPLRSFATKFDHSLHVAEGAKCNSCHRRAARGTALTIPVGINAHDSCFSCHSVQAKANGRDISSCGVCHVHGTLVRTPQNARAFRLGFSHAGHDDSLTCQDCHRIRAGQSQGRQVTAPIALNHHAPIRSFSCMTCHNGARAFGGDDFSVCTRCHKGSKWAFGSVTVLRPLNF